MPALSVRSPAGRPATQAPPATSKVASLAPRRSGAHPPRRGHPAAAAPALTETKKAEVRERVEEKGEGSAQLAAARDERDRWLARLP